MAMPQLRGSCGVFSANFTPQTTSLLPNCTLSGVGSSRPMGSFFERERPSAEHHCEQGEDHHSTNTVVVDNHVVADSCQHEAMNMVANVVEEHVETGVVVEDV